MVGDAVQCEPVSGPNSLLTGKNTGKFAKLGLRRAFVFVKIRSNTPVLPTNCRKSLNREFVEAEQGK